ncbi:uncharacterized protein ACN427_006559 [Glossina fuscipes fuscipes]
MDMESSSSKDRQSKQNLVRNPIKKSSKLPVSTGNRKPNEATGAPGDPLRFGLSGASQKWYIRFLRKGYRPNIARKMALERRRGPASSKPISREIERASADKYKPEKETVNSTGFHVAILAKPYPKKLLTNKELECLQNAIVQEMHKGCDEKMQLEGIQFRPGWLAVDCNNSACVEWLQYIVPRLSDWQGPELATCTGQAVPKTPVITMFLPKCGNKSPSSVLDLVNAQNSNLPMSHWILLFYNRQGDNMVVSLAIDQLSLRSIKASKQSINYEYGRIPIYVNRNSYEDLRILINTDVIVATEKEKRNNNSVKQTKICEMLSY